MAGRAFDMSDTSSPEPRPRSILLIVSLCLNIVLMPVFAVIIFRAAHRVPEIGTGGVLAPRSVMATVPEERDHVQKIIDTHSPRISALRAAAARARKDAFMLLAAPGFTQEQFAKSLDGITAADSALERENVAMMAESLSTLTPAERQTVVDHAKARSRSWFWRLFRPRAPRG